MHRKAKGRSIRDGFEERLQQLRVKKKALSINTLMRSLKHVKSLGPYTRGEMNER